MNTRRLFLNLSKMSGCKSVKLNLPVPFPLLPGNDWLAVGADNRFACSDGGRDYLFFTDNLAPYPAADLPELEGPGFTGLKD